jgi:homoserine O-acetyltransferase
LRFHADLKAGFLLWLSLSQNTQNGHFKYEANLDSIASIAKLQLTHGRVLGNVEVAYRLEGPEDAPLAVVLGGISSHRHVSEWWPILVGDGKAIDPRRRRILSFDFLGGNGATTGPRHAGYEGREFPTVSTHDQAEVLRALLNLLNVDVLPIFIGASYGGMIGLAFAQKYPDRLAELVVMNAAHRNSPHSIALRTLQRQIVLSHARLGRAEEGVVLARALGMATYRTAEEFSQRFEGPRSDPDDVDSFPSWNYIRHAGQKYAARMNPWAYLGLSRSIDLHHVAPETVRTPLTLIAVHEDLLVPTALCEELARGVRGPSELIWIHSHFGHDAFLKEEKLFTNALIGNRRSHAWL